MKTSRAFLLLPFILTGCVGDHHNGAGTPFPPASTTDYAVLIGASTDVAPGTQVGYSITSPSMGTYRFRWTGDADVNETGYREFYGSVWTTGTFNDLIPGCANSACPLEPDQGDFVSDILTVSGGQRIDWDTIASTGYDGFDVAIATDPVYFDAFIDGNHAANLVFYPSLQGTDASPSSLPMAVSGAVDQ
jgi:hypothetical protein